MLMSLLSLSLHLQVSFLLVLNQNSIFCQFCNDHGLIMWSNSDFKTWIEDAKALTMSQDQLTEEAVKFSPVFANMDKKTVGAEFLAPVL